MADGGLATQIALQFALAVQGVLVLFFVISPVMGSLIHRGVAKRSTLVLVVCTMIVIGNLVYMGMVYIVRQTIPQSVIPDLIWIILSFCTAFSISVLIGRYLNWLLGDHEIPAVWVREYEELSEADMMPFDRRRKREMERRKRSRHE